MTQAIQEIYNGGHVSIDQSSKEPLSREGDVLDALEQLLTTEFAKIEISSWMTSDDDTILQNQAPFHVAGHSYKDLPARYVAQPNGLGSYRAAELKNIGEASLGIDVFSNVTTDYLMLNDIDIREYFERIITFLKENGIMLSDVQVERVNDEIAILEKLQDDRDKLSKRGGKKPRHYSENVPFAAVQVPPIGGYPGDDGAFHTRGTSSGEAIELALEGVPPRSEDY